MTAAAALPLLVLTAALTACGSPDTGHTDRAGDPPDQRGEGRAQLPPTKPGTIRVEGTEERVELRLFESPPGFALPFYTYVPRDLIAEPVAAGEGDAVRFSANFAGTQREDAAILLFVYPREVTAEDARAVTRRLAERHGGVEVEERVYDWSLEEFAFSSNDEVGRVSLGERAGRFFYIFVGYPPEFGDGFGPRSHVVLDEWRWADTGQPLSSSEDPDSAPRT